MSNLVLSPVRSRVGSEAVRGFYRAALLGLRRLDDLGVPPRRFDPSADARWVQVQGNLTYSHRIDLLIRDASFRFGAAFHSGTIFGLRGLAGDEPFGPTWASLRAQEARDLWNEVTGTPPFAPRALLGRWAETLGVPAPAGAALPEARPAEQIVAFGAAAAWRVYLSFSGRAALDWAKQVHVVAGTPADRQFAGLLATLDPASGGTRLLDLPVPDAGSGWGERQEAMVFLEGLRSSVHRLDRVVVGPESGASGAPVPLAWHLAARAMVRVFPGATLIE